jgi:hypothetical protein
MTIYDFYHYYPNATFDGWVNSFPNNVITLIDCGDSYITAFPWTANLECGSSITGSKPVGTINGGTA